MYKELTYEKVRELFDYDPETGILLWKKPKYGRRKNGVAGGLDNKGYTQVTYNKKKYLVHRLAFLWMKGYNPENNIDHIDRNPSNNKWNNLREVSHQCNMQNKTCAYTNKSGVCGVQKSGKYGWAAFIRENGKLIYIGYSANLDKAVMLRWKAEVAYNYNGCNEFSEAYLYLKERKLLPKQ